MSIYQNQIDERRRSNVSIFQHTIEHCKRICLPVFVPLKHRYDDPEFLDERILSLVVPNIQPATVYVENMDSFDMARKMSSLYPYQAGKILVLNLASHAKSGGGVENGAQAQEEDLYRKSNYHEANDQSLYPLKMSEVVYSPLVHIIK